MQKPQEKKVSMKSQVYSPCDAAGATEKAHEDRYNALSGKIKADKVFKKDEEIAWKCNNCGYIHIGKDAPEVCPLCDHPQAHFRKQDTSYI